jgi:AhpD family alkylhydroperoxidase
MEPRMTNPVLVIPEAFKALMALSNSAHEAGIPKTTLELVHLRASQINGCGVCIHMHARDLRKAGESDERIDAVAAWRDAPFFTDAERAALALAESVTRLSDRPEAVADEVFNEAKRHYDEKALASLLIAIASVNVWNRLNASTRQVAGSF